ncbi:polysaccharide biosynthesis protein [Miltoncostaea marina]|uniref:polysaccharide biosynthesis protein n=1 Tax=Miltoncostaea marina TaxID=2843215 RepID=UPI001C3D0FFB|nr:nucleoside-diphosphate sugar epimerase/dehydratase [Miltoncostaea marina]
MSRAPLNWSPRAFAHRAGQVAVDAGLVAAAYWLAFYFRFDGDPPGRYEKLFAATVGIVVAVKMVTFAAMRFYTKWWRFTSVRDLQAIVLAVAASSLILTALLSQWRPGDVVPIPRGVLVFDLVLTLVLVGGARFAVRSVIERPPRSELVATGRDVLICGAGDAGITLLREMKRNRSLGYQPVGLIDDDPRKRRLRVHGTRVRGTRADLARVLREVQVDEVIIAMPSAPGRVRQEIVETCRRAGVPCTTLPGLPELITGEVTVSQLREVRVEDVLGRAPVEIDFARVARYLNGRSVLVTGAGGSIGSELCRQVAAIGARRLVMVDHGENNLFEIDLELRERGHAGMLVPVIADCRDPRSMERVFDGERPEIVFHAAAYKHVPMMELNPLQAVANNVLGTAVLTDLSDRYGVERFCLISTDKAVEPETVMGASKALAERVIEAAGATSSTRFAAVRFGNVLGSSGSVLPIFQRQIEQGGPVTVTHAEMTRFFMTIPEAVQLVIEATGIAEGGDVFVLDMGEPVRIMDLARRMIELSGHEPGRDIAIEVVGIRPGEKLHEELFNVDEEVTPTRYGKIMRATRPAIDPDVLRAGLEELAARAADGRPEPVAEALWIALRGGRVPQRRGEDPVTPPSITPGERA